MHTKSLIFLWLQGYAFGSLGGAYACMGDFRQSIQCYSDAFEHAREGGDVLLRAVAMVCAGIVLMQVSAALFQTFVTVCMYVCM